MNSIAYFFNQIYYQIYYRHQYFEVIVKTMCITPLLKCGTNHTFVYFIST